MTESLPLIFTGNVDNILKTFPEIGVVANTTSLQIWSCKLFDPNRHDAYNAPIQRSLWLQAYAFKRLKNYNKATSFPHSPCSVDMSATFYWKYQGIDSAAKGLHVQFQIYSFVAI